MSIQNTYYFYTHSTNIRWIHTTYPMPAGIWGRAAKLVFISIMVDTTEYSTFCLKALKAYLLHFTAHKISNLENFYIEVLRTSQRGNQVEKVGENALRLKYYRNVQKILIRDESERFYCDLEVGTYFVQSLPTSTSQNTDSPTMRVFFCCRWSRVFFLSWRSDPNWLKSQRFLPFIQICLNLQAVQVLDDSSLQFFWNTLWS